MPTDLAQRHEVDLDLFDAWKTSTAGPGDRAFDASGTSRWRRSIEAAAVLHFFPIRMDRTHCGPTASSRMRRSWHRRAALSGEWLVAIQ